jgi:hypothetical protein
MGWTVISKVSIEFPKDSNGLLKQVYEKMEKMNDKNNDDNIFYDLNKYEPIQSEKYGGQIGFEMSGNKGIDYEPLDEIKYFILKKLKGKLKVGFSISGQEFCEAHDGYYYEYEENEE